MAQPQPAVQIPDWLARALRSFAQSFIGTFLLLAVPANVDPAYIPAWDTLQKAGMAALTAATIALLTGAHNALEQGGVIPTLLKPAPRLPAGTALNDPQTLQVLQAIPPPVQQVVITHRVEQAPTPPADSAPPALVLPTVTPVDTPPPASTPG